MNAFDKSCAVLAFALGIVLLVIGVAGLFFGCNASFVLPPILGVMPAFVGWGIIRPVVLAWRKPRPAAENLDSPGYKSQPDDPIVDPPTGDNPYESPRF